MMILVLKKVNLVLTILYQVPKDNKKCKHKSYILAFLVSENQNSINRSSTILIKTLNAKHLQDPLN